MKKFANTFICTFACLTLWLAVAVVGMDILYAINVIDTYAEGLVPYWGPELMVYTSAITVALLAWKNHHDKELG